MGFLIVPVLLLTLVINRVSLKRNRALSLMVPCADGIDTVTCLRNILSAVTKFERPSIICSSSLRVCCCCSSSRLSRSVQLISSNSSWISFCASNNSLWSGCVWSEKKYTRRCNQDSVCWVVGNWLCHQLRFMYQKKYTKNHGFQDSSKYRTLQSDQIKHTCVLD